MSCEIRERNVEISDSQIAGQLMAAVECEHLFVKAMSGCGCGQKFEIYAVSKTFNKVPILQRHRKVQEILKGHFVTIHAITFKLWTPEEYEKKKDEVPSELIDFIKQAKPVTE